MQRWGETFPRWLPVLGGRRVPPALAIVPAALVSVVVTAAGLMFVRQAFSGRFTVGDRVGTFGANWAVVAPELLRPVWGGALGAATLGYRGRMGFARGARVPRHATD